MSIFWPFLKLQFFPLRIILFFPQFRNTIFSDMISVKIADKKKFDFFYKIHGLTPLKNVHFLALVKTSILGSRNDFYLKYQKTIFSDIISLKNSHNRNLDFWTKSMDPFKKCPFFCPLFKPQFFGLKMIVFYLK